MNVHSLSRSTRVRWAEFKRTPLARLDSVATASDAPKARRKRGHPIDVPQRFPSVEVGR
jgi:hypothetical protein